MVKIEFDGLKIQAETADEALNVFERVSDTLEQSFESIEHQFDPVEFINNLEIKTSCPHCEKPMVIRGRNITGGGE